MKLTNSISLGEVVRKADLNMNWERIKNSLIEYPDVPELGIRGSDKDNWVPADFIVVKMDELTRGVIHGAHSLAERARCVVGKVREIISGGVTLEGRPAGVVYQKPISGD